MRIAFISDIHGNCDALESIVSSEEFIKCDQRIFCGDMYGYFHSKIKILDVLKDNCTHMIRGNHDDYLIKLSENKFGTKFYEKYGHAHELALNNLSPEDLSFIRSLPISTELSIEDMNISISHGMPHSNEVYFYEDFQNWQMEMLINDKFEIYIMGHTHHQLQLKKAEKIIVNPGSVGQPRSGKKGAQWCFFDTDLKKFNFITQTYDATSIFNELPNYGGNVTSYLVRKWESLG